MNSKNKKIFIIISLVLFSLTSINIQSALGLALRSFYKEKKRSSLDVLEAISIQAPNVSNHLRVTAEKRKDFPH